MTDLTIVLPAINEADNLERLLPRLHEVARSIGTYEILVVDGGSTDDTAARSEKGGARVHRQQARGYGMALKEAFEQARGRHVVTMDADSSHDPGFIRDLWAARERAAAVVASRYTPGGASEVSGFRSLLSKILNTAFRTVLDIDIRDMSSGFRLYRRDALLEVGITRRNFDALEEILIKLVGLGHPVAEVPFTYRARGAGVSKARVIKFGLQLARTLRDLWFLRNARDWCDYEHRASVSRHPLQRWWQRRRADLILAWHAPGARTLAVGAGAGRLAVGRPGMITLDPSLPKMRFLRRRQVPAVQASLAALPFPSASFEEVLLPQSLELLPARTGVLRDVRRILKPGGRLVVATPDHSRLPWLILKRFYLFLRPGAYGNARISPHSTGSVRRLLAAEGFRAVAARHVAGSELIQLAVRT